MSGQGPDDTGRNNEPVRDPDNRADAGRRPGMHPEAQKGGTSKSGKLAGATIPILALIVFVLVTFGILLNN